MQQHATIVQHLWRAVRQHDITLAQIDTFVVCQKVLYRRRWRAELRAKGLVPEAWFMRRGSRSGPTGHRGDIVQWQLLLIWQIFDSISRTATKVQMNNSQALMAADDDLTRWFVCLSPTESYQLRRVELFIVLLLLYLYISISCANCVLWAPLRRLAVLSRSHANVIRRCRAM